MPTIAQLEKLLQADETDSFVLYALAQQHAKEAQHQEAVGYYDRCIEVEPSQHYAFFHKARSLESLGDAPGAVETLREGLSRAQSANDQKAAGEIAGYLASLGG